MIVQGDQYSVPISITIGYGEDAHSVKPDEIFDVRIKFGNYEKSYIQGEITYDSSRKVWLYPLTAQISRSLLDKTVDYQVAIKTTSNEYIYSPTKQIKVFPSVISNNW